MPTKRKQLDEFSGLDDNATDGETIEVSNDMGIETPFEPPKPEVSEVSPIIKALAKPKVEPKIEGPKIDPKSENTPIEESTKTHNITVKPVPLKPRNLPRFSSLK